MNKKVLSLLLIILLLNMASLIARAAHMAELEEGYRETYRYGPILGDLVSNAGDSSQSWVRLKDRVYENGISGQQTQKIGTIENGARLPCVGLMVDTGWYRVVANGQIAYVSYKYAWLDTSVSPEPKADKPLDISYAVASSERSRSRNTDGAGNYYYYTADKLTDGNPVTSWTPGSGNKLIDDGVGAYVDFHFPKEVTLEGIQILNGYQRSREAFEENSRASQLEVSFKRQGSSDFIDPINFQLADGLVGWQHLNLGKKEGIIAFRLRILDAYRGTKFDKDIGISEVRASGYE